MSVVVGTLSIDLVANTSNFSRSMREMSQLSARTAKDIKDSLEKVGSLGSGMTSGVKAGMAAVVSSGTLTVGALNQVASSVAATIDKFATLTSVVRNSRVEIERLADSVRSMGNSSPSTLQRGFQEATQQLNLLQSLREQSESGRSAAQDRNTQLPKWKQSFVSTLEIQGSVGSEAAPDPASSVPSAVNNLRNNVKETTDSTAALGSKLSTAFDQLKKLGDLIGTFEKLGKVIGLLQQLGTWLGVLGELAAEEGILAAGTYGVELALGALGEALAPLAIPAAIIGGIALIGYAFYQMVKAIREAHKAGVDFLDVLHGLARGGLQALLERNPTPIAIEIANSVAAHTLPADRRHALQPPKPPVGIPGGLDDKNYRPLPQVRSVVPQSAFRLRLKSTAGQTISPSAIASSPQVDGDKFADDAIHNTLQSISQQRLLAEAINKGSDAIARQTALNQAWNQVREKGASLSKVLQLAQAIYIEGITKETVSTRLEISNLEDQLKKRQGMVNAILAGDEALRQATLRERTYSVDQQLAGTVDPQRRQDLQKQKQLIMEVAQTEFDEARARDALQLLSPLKALRNENADLKDKIALLKKASEANDTYALQLQYERVSQENLNRALQRTQELLLIHGSAKDGFTAFFLSMQQQAKTTANIVYEALHSTFDKLSDNLTEFVTGGKTAFGKMFQDIGKQILNAEIRKGLQGILAEIGKRLKISMEGVLDGKTSAKGQKPGSTEKATGGILGAVFGGKKAGEAASGRPDGSQLNPWWVRVLSGEQPPIAATGAGEVQGPLAAPDGGELDSSRGGNSGSTGFLGTIFSKLGGFFSKLKGIFGSLFGQSSPLGFLGSLVPHAAGGYVSPAGAYLVGESGPEILTGVSGYIHSNIASQRMLSSGSGASYTINMAPGNDPAMTEQAVRRAILASHSSAVNTSVKAVQEQQRRLPQR